MFYGWLDWLKVHVLSYFLPSKKRELLKRSIADIKATGIEARAAKFGTTIADFSLPNAQGKTVRLRELLAHGPVVVVFYRGFLVTALQP